MDPSVVLAALSDPTRRQIYELISTGPHAVGDLARLVPVSRPAVSQHLKVLVDAGLLAVEPRGARRIYAAVPTGLHQLRDWMEHIWDRAFSAFEHSARDEAGRKEQAMHTTHDIPPVTKHRTVPLPIDEAFDLFTRRMGEWWPVTTHSIAGRDIEIRFEGRVGGRVVEVAGDATETSWADVLAWDPPHRFVLSWHPNPAPVAASTLEVRFLALADGGTAVHLEHRGWEEFGAGGDALRADYQSGWDVVLGALPGAIAR